MHRMIFFKTEKVMPITDAFVIAAIVFVFTVFGIVLAWAEYQTRNLPASESVNTRQVQPESVTAPQAQTGRNKQIAA